MAETEQRQTAGAMMASSAHLTKGYAEMVCRDIPAERFARKPDGVETNHPAWVIGHLALYPPKLMQLLDAAGAPEVPAGWDSLFDAKSECRDDPDSAIYPPKDELLGVFLGGMDAAIAAMRAAGDDALHAPNSAGPAPDVMNTAGSLANFLLTSHPMMHLGQISAWRRVMGLGPCM